MNDPLLDKKFSGNEHNLKLMREFQHTLKTKTEPYDPEKHLPKEWLARLKNMNHVTHGDQALLVSDEEQRMIDAGAMEIDWTPPYPCVKITMQPNPNWDDSWPEHEQKHALQVDDPENGPRAKKIKWVPRFVPRKLWHYEALQKHDTVDAAWEQRLADADQ